MPRKIKKSSESKKKVSKTLSNSSEPLSNVPLKDLPSVSIIMPMYNVEEYIEMALNSVLWQTFKDFEIIVVDDCSTDKSYEIAESYIPKFGGRLNLIKLETNHGYGSIPRNEGLKVARGEYVFFMDSDDVITEDALEKTYRDAQRINSDVIFFKSHSESSGIGDDFFKQIKLKGDSTDFNVDLVTDDIEIRLKAWFENMFPPAPWKKFVKRELLVENNINFLSIMQEDSVWTFELICNAKKIIYVPYAIYLYRQRENSVCDIAYSGDFTPISIRKKFERVIIGLKHIDEVMSRIEFFSYNPDWRYKVIEFIFHQNIDWFMKYYGDFPPRLVYEKFKDAFKDETGNFDVLISYMVSNQIVLLKTLEKFKDNE